MSLGRAKHHFPPPPPSPAIRIPEQGLAPCSGKVKLRQQFLSLKEKMDETAAPLLLLQHHSWLLSYLLRSQSPLLVLCSRP